jgi:hypothetical protein
VVGFHCPKGVPDEQMEAHHYCRVVNDDLLQCVLFDGNTREANLIGVEHTGHDLPLGEPQLMWSFNRDGECDEGLKRDRDVAMGLDTSRKREQRHDLVVEAHPQHGVDAVADQFPGSTPVPGVVEADGADQNRS